MPGFFILQTPRGNSQPSKEKTCRNSIDLESISQNGEVDHPKEFIGPVIGPGDKMIQQIQADTNTIITLQPEFD